jgi:Polyketide cyclase / dehydrase and lipid transport
MSAPATRRELPRFLAPITGAVAVATCAAMVGLHLYGDSLPARHVARVVAEVPVPPEQAWALLSDLSRRPEWRPHVLHAVNVQAEGPQQVWLEQDEDGDRFEFVVVSADPMTLSTATARPDDIGMYAEWTWSVAPGPAGTSIVTAVEDGAIRNVLVRGWWSLRVGPYAGVEADLRALVRHLGGDEAAVRRVP